MGALIDQRRRRTIIAGLAGIIGLVSLPMLSIAAAKTLKNSKEGRNILVGLPDLILVPPTPAALFAAVDDQGEVTAISLLALSPPRNGVVKGGTIIEVPVGAKTNLADGTVGRLADAYAHGGQTELVEAAEGLLGVTMLTSMVAGADGIAALLAPYAPLDVNLAADVVHTDAAGVDQVVAPAGTVSADAAMLAAMLTAHEQGRPETDRFGRIGDLWSTIALRVGPGIGTPITTTTSTVGAATAAPIEDPAADFATFWQAMFAGESHVYRLNSTPVTDPVTNPAGSDMVDLYLAEVIYITATVLPSSVSPAFSSITFYVRSPLGDSRLTLEAVSRLAFNGANVVLVKEDTSLETPALNTISFVDPSDGAQAEAFVKTLGSGYTVVPAEYRIDNVDVVLTLGEQWRKDADLERLNVATTVAPPATEG